MTQKLFDEVLGPTANIPSLKGLWMFLNGLSSHDISVMRELIDVPQKIISAARGGGGKFLTVLFQ